MRCKAFLRAMTVAMLAAAPSFAQIPSYEQSPADPQGLIRERDQSAERLRQEQLQRSQQELADRDRAAREARQRLNSLNRDLLDRPALPPGAAVAPNASPTMPVDRAEQMRRDETVRRTQQNYDNARRALDDASRAVRSGAPSTAVTGAGR